MGIMDSLSNAVGSATQGGSALTAVTQLLNQGGGIQGLIGNFQSQGLGHVIQSWIGTGPNIPIEPNQLRSVLGEDKVTQISQSSGMQSNDLMQKLSQYLPLVIDKLTPDGQVNQDRFSGSSLMSLGKSLFH